MSVRIVLVSTAYGLATAVAAMDSATMLRCDRSVLVITDNTAMPEATPPLTAIAGVETLFSRFDAVFEYNAAIEPLHPAGWHPRPDELPLLERYLRGLWSLDSEPVRILVESLAVNPSLSLCRIFGDAAIDVFADGLMSYGPTRNPIPDSVGIRVEQLSYLDLVDGLRPVLLSEWEIAQAIIPAAAFRAVIGEMLAGSNAADADTSPRPKVALVLGQYLSANGLLTDAEEAALYTDMIIGCARAGERSIVFKPHPSAPLAHRSQLRDAAHRLGIDLTFNDAPELAEMMFQRGDVGVVVGCFSTALLTARALYGLPVVRYGTDLMLARLAPYQNSNRIPLTIVDAVIPDAAGSAQYSADVASTGDLAELVVAVSYAMQPKTLRRRRAEARYFLEVHYTDNVRYFKRRRLTSLDLPGALPARAKAAPGASGTIVKSPGTRAAKARLQRRVRRAAGRLQRRLTASRPLR